MIKKDFDIRLDSYPQDIEYYKTISKGMGLLESEMCKLFSIVGKTEFLDIIQKTSARDYICISEDKHDPLFRLNLHIHTDASDGVLTPKEYLEQAKEYADKTAAFTKDLDRIPALVLAMTDHDSLASIKETLSILIKNPTKYKNVRIVLGCEFSTVYRREDILNFPLSSEVLCYCLNPFNKNIENMLSNIKTSREKSLDKAFDDLYKEFPEIEFSKKELKSHSLNSQKHLGTNWTFDLYGYVQTKVRDESQLDRIINICFKSCHVEEDDKNKIYNELRDIFNNVTDFTVMSVPHPAKIEFKYGVLKDSFINECNQNNLNPGMEASWQLLMHLESLGIKAMEIYYQGYEGPLKEAQDILLSDSNVEPYNDTQKWVKHFATFAEHYNLIKTGSYDTHGPKIFRKI